MSEKAWYESCFGKEYFDIYGDAFPAERTIAQVDGIVSLINLGAGSRILDLACGHGRYSILLSKRGFDVTGYGLSEVFLDRARADAEAQGASVRWIEGDMRELPFEGEFDAVTNVFTSFGYFDHPEDDMKTLRRIRRALRPGGRFLLETIHRDGLPARFQPVSAEKTSKGMIVFHERAWDLARDVIDDKVTLIRSDGSRIGYTTAVRLRSLNGFLALVRTSGLQPEGWYGGLDGRALDLSSSRMVLISQRPQSSD